MCKCTIVLAILLVLPYYITPAVHMEHCSRYSNMVRDEVARFIRYVFNDSVIGVNITAIDSLNGFVAGGVAYGYKGSYAVRFSSVKHPPTDIRVMKHRCNIGFNSSEAHIRTAWNVYAAALSLYNYTVFEDIGMFLQQILWKAFNEKNYSYSNTLVINGTKYEIRIYSAAPDTAPGLIYSRKMLVTATKTYRDGTCGLHDKLSLHI